MSFIYTGEKTRRLNGAYDMDAVDLRVKLLLNTTTADTDQDAVVLSDIGTLGEVTDVSYAEKALTTLLVSQVNASDLAKLTADAATWSALTTGGTVQAILLYRRVDGTAANDQPVAFIDTGGFPFSCAGANVTYTPSADGILQAT